MLGNRAAVTDRRYIWDLAQEYSHRMKSPVNRRALRVRRSSANLRGPPVWRNGRRTGLKILGP
jgi:hypothetical protein